jgi:hypothetical protein
MKNISFGLLVLIVLLMSSSCRKPDETKEIKQLIDRYVSVWNGDNLNKLDNIVAKNFQLRIVPEFAASTGIQKLKAEITQTRDYFPDFELTETERIFTGDTVVVIRWTATGTFKNRNQMSTSTGKINVPGFSVIFFTNGKLTGEWIAYSDLTWYKQLGFTLKPPEKPAT